HPRRPSLSALERLDRAVRPDAADEAVVVLDRGMTVDVGDEIQVQLGVVLDGLGRLEPLDRQHPGGGGGRGLLRLATAGNGEGGEPEREDTPRSQAPRGLLYGSGAASKSAGKAPPY